MALLQTSFTTQLLLLFSIVFLFKTPIAIAFTQPTTPYDNDSELNRENIAEIQNRNNMTYSPLIRHDPKFDFVGKIRKKRFVVEALGAVRSVLTIFDFILNKISNGGENYHTALQKITSQLNSVKDQVVNTIKEIKIDGMNTRISPHEVQIKNSLRAADDYLTYKTEDRKKMFLDGYQGLEQSIFNIFELLTKPSVTERLSILEQLKQYYDVTYTNLKFSYI